MKYLINTIFLIAFAILVQGQDTIVRYEYWIDNDYSSKTTQILSPWKVDYTLNADISVSGLTSGIHAISIRFGSKNNFWSPVITSFFEKTYEPVSNNLKLFEYWFNNDYTNKTSTSLAEVADAVIIDAIPTVSTPYGINVYSYRVKDSNKQWSAVNSKMVYKLPPSNSYDIVLYEYWFDDGITRTSVKVNPEVKDLLLIEDIPTSSIGVGIHTFNIRTKDSNGKWSAVLSKMITKLPEPSPTENKIDKYEYWFDYSTERTSVNVDPANKNFILIEGLSTGSITPGIHSFSFRTKDTNGNWSTVISKMFTRLPETSSENNIEGYEYWFDTKSTDKVFVAKTPSEFIQINDDIATTGLSSGVHAFNIRFKDSKKQWSSTLTKFFFKAEILSENSISGYRYWIDGNTSSIQYVNLSTPVKSLHTIINIDALALSKGNHTISIQYCDISKKWSQATTGTFYKAYPLANFTASETTGCDNLTVTFTNTSTESDSYLWDFGDGTTSTLVNPVHTYNSAALYTVSLTATDLTTGHSKTKTVSDLVKVYSPVITLGSDTTFCDGDTLVVSVSNSYINYDWNDEFSSNIRKITTAGTWTLQVKDEHNCLSNIATLITGIYPLPIVDLGNDKSVCSGVDNNLDAGAGFVSYHWSDGYTLQTRTLTESDTISVYVVDTHECVSLPDTFRLEVRPVFETTQNFFECDGFAITVGSNIYTQTGVYVDVLTANNGCDSTVTTNLTIYPVYSFTENHSICQGETYTWQGTNYNATGVYTKNYSTISGCDSTYTLNLTVNPIYSFTENHSICDGETYTWQGTTYNAAGVYTKSYTSISGCDSTYTLNLAVNPVYSFTENHSICQGETYSWHGTNYDVTGAYTKNYSTISGCDSTYTLNLTVNQVYSFTENHSICNGETYTWQGTNYNATGVYTKSYTSVSGCDSTYTLNLAVNPVYSFTENHSICDGETYTWQGTTYNASGAYTKSYTSVSGCDSTYTLNLAVNPVYSFTENHSICDGETYTWQGTTYNASGAYTKSYTSVSGCDSTYTLNLAVNPVYSFTENHSICDGETYTWQGTTYYAAGVYTKSYTSISGCDSTYTLNLAVNPVYSFTENHSICDGETYTWQGTTYTTAGLYSKNFTSISGCDSTFTLNLAVNPVYSFTENHSICQGETYSWHGTTYNASGAYTKSYTSVSGCDSTYTLNLTVNPIYSFIENHSICDGETYTWQGTTYTTAGLYSKNFTSISGCDSILVLNLTIYDALDISTTLYNNTITANANGVTYQWINCNNNSIITGAVSKIFTPIVNGNYAVIISNGICTDTSSCINISTVGIEINTNKLFDVSIFPNPTDGLLTISTGNVVADDLQVTNLLGQCVLTLKPSTNISIINFKGYNNGIYFIRLQHSNKIKTVKIIKNE